MRLSIIVSGTGGQGVVFAGDFLSKAFFNSGLEIVYTHSYGAEARGGSCKSELIISEEKIYELSLPEVDILIAMSAPAYRRYLNRVKFRGLVITDSEVSEQVQVEHKLHVETIIVPARKMAKERGNVVLANMILLGVLIKKTGLLELSDMKKILDEFHPEVRKLNLDALNAGFSLDL